MDKIKYCFLVLLLMLSWGSIAQNQLEVIINDLRNDQGVVSIELLDKNEKAVDGTSSKIENKTCTILFKNLPDGQYAIQFFHDENANKEMDTNFIGIPKEGYGFSNDPHGIFGPKGFEKWLFEVKGNTRISMTTKYF